MSQPFLTVQRLSLTSTDSGVAGDFDGDGRVDLVLGNLGDRTVGFVRNLGDGTFGDEKRSAGDIPVAAADFNGDGRLDLLTLYEVHYPVALLLGRGDGTFEPPREIAGISHEVMVGDFNTDGRVDFASSTDTGVEVYLGRGDGTFTLSSVVVPPKGSIDGFTMADFDGDGKLDLAVLAVLFVRHRGSILMYRGNGDGSFTPTREVGAIGPWDSSDPFHSERLLTADLNGDGRMDLAIVKSTMAMLTVLLGKGDWMFARPLNLGTVNGPGQAIAAEFFPVAPRSRPDVVLAGSTGSSHIALSIFANTTVWPPVDSLDPE